MRVVGKASAYALLLFLLNLVAWSYVVCAVAQRKVWKPSMPPTNQAKKKTKHNKIAEIGATPTPFISASKVFKGFI